MEICFPKMKIFYWRQKCNFKNINLTDIFLTADLILSFLHSIKLGVIEDSANRSRLAKLLRFQTSNGSDNTLLADYVTRMKPKQDSIYYMAAANRAEAEKSPFVERLLAKGYEVLYLTEPVDEYCMQSMPEFEGKKFQNAAKEGLKLGETDKSKKRVEELQKQYEPLTKWLQEKVLKEKVWSNLL